jgi:hypothetical protein
MNKLLCVSLVEVERPSRLPGISCDEEVLWA